MAANAGAVFAGVGQDLVTGTVLSAPYPATLPALDATFFDSAPDAAFKDGGFIGESGVTLSQNSSWGNVKNMDGVTVARWLQEFNGTVQTNFLELNERSLKNIFGESNVAVTLNDATHGTRIVVTATADEVSPRAWIFRMKAGLKRAAIVIPQGQVTTVGDIGFTPGDAATVDATIECIPDNAGVSFYIILDDGTYIASLVPTITSALPTAQTAGNLVTIRGTRFVGLSGAAAVKFGATNAASYTVLDSNTIVASMPAGSAGAANITVTNGSGTSAAFTYTRGA